jgi:hypothetical protein
MVIEHPKRELRQLVEQALRSRGHRLIEPEWFDCQGVRLVTRGTSLVSSAGRGTA